MRLLFLFFFSLSVSTLFAQKGYVFQTDKLQITFPDKPIKDTTVQVSGQNVRAVVSKDSLSTYLLSIIQSSTIDSISGLPNSNIIEFTDGVMDGMKQSYNADVFFVKEIVVHTINVREYAMKGNIRGNPVTAKNWVWLKNGKAYVCQHVYLTKNEKAVSTNQQAYFQSLAF